MSFRYWGTVPSMMLHAKPSTKAVLPTPASPMMSTLGLPIRPRISIIMRVSRSRHTIGYTFLSAARAVLSVQYLSKLPAPAVHRGASLPGRSVCVLTDFFILPIPLVKRSCISRSRIGNERNSSVLKPASGVAMAASRQSGLISSSPHLIRTLSACSNSSLTFGSGIISPAPAALGYSSILTSAHSRK